MPLHISIKGRLTTRKNYAIIQPPTRKEDKARVKVTLGKNESHDYARESFCLRGGEWLSVRSPSYALRHLWVGLCFIMMLVLVRMDSQEVLNRPLVYVISLLVLPLHELCHALYLWLTRRRVYAIRFFPYWFKWGNVGAYVKADMPLYTRGEYALLIAFPLLLLSLLPAVVAVFCPGLRIWLGWIAILNLAMASWDVVLLLWVLRLPKGARGTDGGWCRFHEGETVILQRLRIKPGATRMSDIERTDFRVEGRHLVEISPTDDKEVHILMNEFKIQFQLSDTE